MPEKEKDLTLGNSANKKLVEQFILLVKQIEYNINQKIYDKKEETKQKFRLRHFKNAIRIIRQYPEKISKAKDLEGISGVGKGIMEKIDEILKHKKICEIEQDQIKDIQKNMNVIDELSKVINIGSKVAKQLVDKHDIKSIDDLKKRIQKGEIEVNDKIAMGLKYYGIIKEDIPRKEMDLYNNLLKELVVKVDKDLILTVAGSYRRGKNTSNDIDVLITTEKVKTAKQYEKMDKNYLEEFVNYLKNKKIIVDDLTEATNGTKYMGFCKLPRKPVRRLDIRFVAYESYHSALLYFTGSYQLNTDMRQIAKTMGLKLNEYGLYKVDDNGNDKLIKTKSEEDIFKKLKIPYLLPTERG